MNLTMEGRFFFFTSSPACSLAGVVAAEDVSRDHGYVEIVPDIVLLHHRVGGQVGFGHHVKHLHSVHAAVPDFLTLSQDILTNIPFPSKLRKA